MEMTLNMPQNYVEIEQEEMMYLDGGWKTYSNWWGLSTKITKSECSKIAAGASVAALIPKLAPVAGIVAAVAGLGAAWNGLYCNVTWLGQSWISF